MAGNDKHQEQEEQPWVIISDKRHSRDENAAEAEAQEQTAKPESKPQAAAPPPPPPVTPAEPAAAKAEPVAQAAGPAEDDLAHAAEMEQLKLIFEAGLTSYLAGQISMFINFALIYLGRAANPATGLVAVDIKKAKSAIDTLEFVSAQIREELPAAEQKQLAAIVADLKFNFTQTAITSDPLPPKGNGT
jgi:hypothetical protein